MRGKTSNSSTVSLRKPEARENYEDLEVGGRKLLKRSLERCDGVVRTANRARWNIVDYSDPAQTEYNLNYTPTSLGVEICTEILLGDTKKS
jgi:hypothetical protein